MGKFISIPLSYVDNPIDGRIELERDIDNRIEMLDNLIELTVFTPRGSFNADPDFGFEYWNHEMSNIHYLVNDHTGAANSQSEVTKRQCQDSIRHSLQTYCPELKNVNISMNLVAADSESQGRRKVLSKYSVTITVEGIINDGMSTNRPYRKDVVFLIEPTAKQFRY